MKKKKHFSSTSMSGVQISTSATLLLGARFTDRARPSHGLACPACLDLCCARFAHRCVCTDLCSEGFAPLSNEKWFIMRVGEGLRACRAQPSARNNHCCGHRATDLLLIGVVVAIIKPFNCPFTGIQDQVCDLREGEFYKLSIFAKACLRKPGPV